MHISQSYLPGFSNNQSRFITKPNVDTTSINMDYLTKTTCQIYQLDKKEVGFKTRPGRGCPFSHVTRCLQNKLARNSIVCYSPLNPNIQYKTQCYVRNKYAKSNNTVYFIYYHSPLVMSFYIFITIRRQRVRSVKWKAVTSQPKYLKFTMGDLLKTFVARQIFHRNYKCCLKRQKKDGSQPYMESFFMMPYHISCGTDLPKFSHSNISQNPRRVLPMSSQLTRLVPG